MLFFYWSSGIYTIVLVASILLNYTFGWLIHKNTDRKYLILGVFFNLIILFFFKYTYFVTQSVGFFGSHDVETFASSIILPIGISFYTFQGVSYLIDIWRREVVPERDIITFGAYKAFFPQLIAGPIVRYKDVYDDFHHGTVGTDMFAAGAARFLVGLGKKVLVADTVAIVADAAFAVPGADHSFASAWIGAIAYSLQIYFDFSGYSDMAIGLALMFGIRFRENFDHPYAASTVTEFWRRWHISLSGWFRDYLYIPLGGNRKGPVRTYVNLGLVFLATGLWHGAAWTFVLWGVFHGALLIGERLVLGAKASAVTSLPLRLIYFFPAVIFGWVLFRAADLPSFLAQAKAMLLPAADGAFSLPAGVLVSLSPVAVLVLVVASLAILFQDRIPPLGVVMGEISPGPALQWLRLGFTVVIALLCLIFVIPQSFSPFLYFRF